MSNRYIGDHIAGDHIHTDITTGNIEEPQQKFCQGTVSIDYWGEGGGEGLSKFAVSYFLFVPFTDYI